MHDPLWLLGRQWQLGEFEGEDAGTPLTVRVVTNTVPVDRWARAAIWPTRAVDRGAHDLLEPLVEREPCRARTTRPGPARPGRGGRRAARGARRRRTRGGAGYRQALLDNCPLDLDPLAHPDGAHAALDPEWVRLVRLLARPADGRRRVGVRAGSRRPAAACRPGSCPPTPPTSAVLIETFTAWARWYRAEVSPLAERRRCLGGRAAGVSLPGRGRRHRAGRARPRWRRHRLAQLRRRRRPGS